MLKVLNFPFQGFWGYCKSFRENRGKFTQKPAGKFFFLLKILILAVLALNFLMIGIKAGH